MNKALFLDRDGVININFGHVHKKENFVFIEGIFELCKMAQDEGFLIIVVTNQAGIGKGFYDKESFFKLDSWMKKVFLENGIIISKTYYCPHVSEDNCTCRKPKPGMIINALKEYNIDPKKSILIGDKVSDIIAGKSAGIDNVLLFKEEDHFHTIFNLKNIIVSKLS